MNILWQMDPLDNWAEMPWILVHPTWQMNPLWPMNPQWIENRCLEYHYTKLGRQTYFGQWTPLKQTCINGIFLHAVFMAWHLVANRSTLSSLLPGSPSSLLSLPESPSSLLPASTSSLPPPSQSNMHLWNIFKCSVHGSHLMANRRIPSSFLPESSSGSCCYCFMLLLCCTCHCGSATTNESQQQQLAVTTGIKTLIITKYWTIYAY